jgi:hypothetical protein
MRLTDSQRKALELDFQTEFDQNHDPVILLGNQYSPSDVLQLLDPTAYDQAFNDWLDGLDQLEELEKERVTQDLIHLVDQLI